MGTKSRAQGPVPSAQCPPGGVAAVTKVCYGDLSGGGTARCCLGLAGPWGDAEGTLSIPTMCGWSSPWTGSSTADPRMPSWAGGPSGMRGGESSTSERLPGPCCTPGHSSPVPGGFVTSSVWVCQPAGTRAHGSPHPHAAFPALFPSTSPLSVQPRAGCRPGQEPGQGRFLGPNQQTPQWTEKDAVPSACAPTACPSSPQLPPLARLSPLPMLAGLWMQSLGVHSVAGRSEVQPRGAAQTPHKWAAIFGNLPPASFTSPMGLLC